MRKNLETDEMKRNGEKLRKILYQKLNYVLS